MDEKKMIEQLDNYEHLTDSDINDLTKSLVKSTLEVFGEFKSVLSQINEKVNNMEKNENV